MKTNYWFYILFIVLGLLVVVILYDTFNQPGVGELEGNFQEISKSRNENNTGPVIRVYAVYTDAGWEAMKAYGDFMPHTKYGNTKVFFFDQKLEEMDLNLKAQYFDTAFQSSCKAVYEKSAMGVANLQQNPFEY